MGIEAQNNRVNDIEETQDILEAETQTENVREKENVISDDFSEEQREQRINERKEADTAKLEELKEKLGIVDKNTNIGTQENIAEQNSTQIEPDNDSASLRRQEEGGKSNRQFVDSKGNPEADPARSRVKHSVYGPSHEKIMMVIDKIKFGQLRSMLTEIGIRSGVDPDKLNFVTMDRVSGNKLGKGVDASYISDKNLIDIDPDNLEYEIREFNIPRNAVTLKLLCHELVHSSNRTFFQGSIEYEKGEIDRFSYLSGYQQKTEVKVGDSIEKANQFHFFDEGVTEKLARELAVRYLEQQKMLGQYDLLSPEDLDRAIDIYKNFPTFGRRNGDEVTYSYQDASVEVVNAFIDRISNDSGLSAKMVWESIIRSQFEGEDLSSQEMKELFETFFSPAFAEKLANLDGSEMLDLINEIRQQPEVVTPGAETVSPNKKQIIKKNKLIGWLKSKFETNKDYS